MKYFFKKRKEKGGCWRRIRGQEELSSKLPPLWLCGLGQLTAPLWACVLICETGILNALASQTGLEMFTSVKLPACVPGIHAVMLFPAQSCCSLPGCWEPQASGGGGGGMLHHQLKRISLLPLGSWEGPWRGSSRIRRRQSCSREKSASSFLPHPHPCRQPEKLTLPASMLRCLHTNTHKETQKHTETQTCRRTDKDTQTQTHPAGSLLNLSRTDFISHLAAPHSPRPSRPSVRHRVPGPLPGVTVTRGSKWNPPALRGEHFLGAAIRHRRTFHYRPKGWREDSQAVLFQAEGTISAKSSPRPIPPVSTLPSPGSGHLAGEAWRRRSLLVILHSTDEHTTGLRGAASPS